MIVPVPIAFGLLAAAAVLAVATVAPAGSDLADIHAETLVEWHPLRGEWSVETPTIGIKDSKVLNLRGIFSNALSLTSGSQPVVFTLQTAAGAPIDEKEDRTGRGGIFGGSEKVGVTFTRIPPGDYVLRVRVVGEDGNVDAEKARIINLVKGAV